MTSRTPRRHRRLALMAAGTVAAMVLVPGTALAQETPLDGDSVAEDSIVKTLQEVLDSVGGESDTPDLDAPELPGDEAIPGEVPALPTDSDDDSEGHETEDPEFPDHGSGFVGNVDLSEEDILDLTEYDATVEDDGSTHSDVTVLGLLGDEIVGTDSSSDGNTESSENPTEGLCEATGGAICLSLLYQDTYALVDDEGSFAGARGGVLSLCLLGDDETVTTTYECDGLSAGAAEGEAEAERDGKTGHTEDYSDNELVKACLTEGWGGEDGFTCEGLLGLSVLHSASASESVTPDTDRGSWLIGLDLGGDDVLRIQDPIGVSVLPDCGELAILCLFLNQGESFIYENPQGAGSAQEALHLDLLGNDPALILVELGRAESIAHLESPAGCEPGEKGPCDKPECSDGIDNDNDGKIDFPADPDCDSPEDDSESGAAECKDGIDNDKDGKIDFPADPDCENADDDSEAGKDGGLAKTGADVAPMLAGAFLLIGLGALSVAVTRRRVGKHTI